MSNFNRVVARNVARRRGAFLHGRRRSKDRHPLDRRSRIVRRESFMSDGRMLDSDYTTTATGESPYASLLDRPSRRSFFGRMADRASALARRVIRTGRSGIR
jgi:hypothetical protein